MLLHDAARDVEAEPRAAAPSLVGTGWVSAGIGDATASTEVGGLPAGYEEATVILTEAVPDGDVSRFLRVRVELPGSP